MCAMITILTILRRRAWLHAAFAALLAVPAVVLVFWFWERLTVTPAVRFEGPSFQLLAGQGASTQFGLQIPRMASEGRIIVGLPMGARDAADFDSLSFDIRGLENAAGAGLYWTRADNPAVGIPRPLSLDEVRQGRVALTGYPGWEGGLESVGFVVQGPLRGEVLFRFVNLQPAKSTVWDVAKRLAVNWMALGDWDGGSVNFHIGAERTERRLTPVLSVILWVMAWLLICRVAQINQVDLPRLAAVLLAGLLLGWAALDLRWQMTLLHRHLAPPADPLVALDERRAIFWAENKPKLFSDPTRRVFVVTDDPSGYVAHRTRYHLGSVRSSFGMLRLPSEAERRVGDYVLILGSREPVRFDPLVQQLVVGTMSIPAKLIFNVPEAGALVEITDGVSR